MMRQKPRLQFIGLVFCLCCLLILAFHVQGCGYDGSPAGTLVTDEPAAGEDSGGGTEPAE